MMTSLSRRGFIFGAAAATFAIVRPEILMPIKQLILPTDDVVWPLEPGEYTMIIDDIEIKDDRLMMKLWRHAAHYQMNPQKFEEIYHVRPSHNSHS